MSSALSGISDLVGSIINSIIAVITSIFDAIQSVLGVGFGAVKDVGGLAGGLIDFVLQNIVVIGVLVAGAVGFSAYQQRRGKTVSGKKTI